MKLLKLESGFDGRRDEFQCGHTWVEEGAMQCFVYGSSSQLCRSWLPEHCSYGAQKRPGSIAR